MGKSADILFRLAPLFIVLLSVLFFGRLILRSIRLGKGAQQRVKSFQNLARVMNFTFHGEVPYANLSGAAQSELFTSGNAGSRRIYNMMTGLLNNFEASVFDFACSDYTESDDSNGNSQTVVMLDFSKSKLPPFTLKPESGGVMRAVSNALGNRNGELKFPAHPAFSANYLLRGADEQRIRALFSDPVLSFYESALGLSTEGGGKRLIFYRRGVKINPPKIRQTLDEALTAANLFLNSNLASGAAATPPAQTAPAPEPPKDSPTETAAPTINERFQRLDELRDVGLLTTSEYDLQRAELHVEAYGKYWTQESDYAGFAVTVQRTGVTLDVEAAKDESYKCSLEEFMQPPPEPPGYSSMREMVSRDMSAVFEEIEAEVIRLLAQKKAAPEH